MWRTGTPLESGTYLAYTGNKVKLLKYKNGWNQKVIAWRSVPACTIGPRPEFLPAGIFLIITGLLMVKYSIDMALYTAPIPLALGTFLILLTVKGFWGVSFNDDKVTFWRFWFRRTYKASEVEWTERKDGYRATVNGRPVMTIFDKEGLCGILKLTEN